MKNLFTVWGLLITLACSVGAQGASNVAKPEAASSAVPTLSEVQRLQLRLALKEVENTQLKLRVLQEETNSIVGAANALLKELQKPGYELDLQKLIYLPLPKTDTGPLEKLGK